MNSPGFAKAGASKGILLVMTAVIFFSFVDLLAKYLTRFYPIPMIVWGRFAFHLLFIAVALGPKYRLNLIRTAHPAKQLVRSVVLLFGSIFFVSALKYMPLAESTAIAFLAPVFVTLMSVIFLKEKVDAGRWIAVLCGFGGVLAIIRPGGHVFTWAVLLPIANALSFAAYQILTRRLAGIESPYTSVFYAGLAGTIAPLAILPGIWVTPTDIVHIAMFLGTGILGGFGHLILIKAYEYAPASRLAPFSYSQLIWVVIIGFIFFSEFPDAWSIAGIATLVGSGIYIARRQRLAPATTAPTQPPVNSD